MSERGTSVTSGEDRRKAAQDADDRECGTREAHLPNEGLRLTQTIRSAHPAMPNYVLYPGDLMVRDESGDTWMKEAPGLAIGGFVLTDEQEAALEPVRFACYGLAYVVEPVATLPSESPTP